MILYTCFNSYQTTIREPSDDEWDSGDTRNEWDFPISCSLVKSENSNENFFIHDEVKSGDRVYLLYAIWGTGDSFGHSEACYCTCIYASVNHLKVQFAKQLIDKNILFLPDNCVLSSIPWSGYFDSLDYLDIITLIVD